MKLFAYILLSLSPFALLGCGLNTFAATPTQPNSVPTPSTPLPTGTKTPSPPVVLTPSPTVPLTPISVPTTPVISTPGSSMPTLPAPSPTSPTTTTPPSLPSNPTTPPASLTAVVLSGVISPSPVGSTTQLHATGIYSDGTQKDDTTTGTWSLAPVGALTISRNGAVTCNAIGTASLAVFVDGLWSASSSLTCSESFTALTLSQTSLLSRVGSTVSIEAFATAASGSRQDVTALSSYSTLSPIATVSPSGTVSCIQPGATTITVAYASLTQNVSLACSPMSWNSPTYFLEQSAEFTGPFASWVNVKTAFGAKGDGLTDDTAAIQKAFNSINSSGNNPVLWFPAGTYVLSSTLTLTHLNSFSIRGEDPTSTILKWAGPNGATMLQTDASTYFRISRLTMDGSGKAATAEDFTTLSNSPGGYYSTFNEISDQHIIGVTTGIKLSVAAETTIERVFFDGLSGYGVTLGNFNTLNIFINDSLFKNCGTGVSNIPGAGNFVVTNSYFERSAVADLSIGNTGYFTSRHNTSSGSTAHFVAGNAGQNAAQITIQNSTILDPSSVPFQIGNEGPLMLIDNVIRMQDPSQPAVVTTDIASMTTNILSFGNTYTTSQSPRTQGEPSLHGTYQSYDDSVVDPALIPNVTIPANVYIPPNLHRTVYEVSTNGNGGEIQNQIDKAISDGGLNSVVHIPAGQHRIYNTISVPAGSNIQLLGDDVTFSYVLWNGSGTGPLLQLNGSNVTVEDLFLAREGGSIVDGVALSIDDQPSTNVMVDQAELQQFNAYSVNFDGIEHANAELFSTYTLGSITGVNVVGGPYRTSGAGSLGITNFYSGSLQSEAMSTSFSVNNGGKLMIQDNWHDGGGTSPRNFVLSGRGTVTEQVGMVDMNSNQPFEIDDFQGKVTLIGLSFTGGFLTQPGVGHTDLLTLGLNGSDVSYSPQSNGNLIAANIMDSYWNNGAQQIPQQNVPDVAWLRGMLAQTRSEYAAPRLVMNGNGTRKRIERVFAKGFTSGLHITPVTSSSSLFYTLGQNGQTLSNAIGASGQCLESAADMSSQNAGWKLSDAGDGDYILSSASGDVVLSATGSSDESGLGLTVLTGGAAQRWMVRDVGDGRRQLINRALNAALSWNGGSCPSLSQDLSSESTKWTVTAH